MLYYRTMKHGTQKQLAQAINVTPAAIGQFIKTKARPSWSTAKKLASVTGANPAIFLDGSKEQIIAAIEAWSEKNLPVENADHIQNVQVGI